jgi:hypothetical protein
VLLAGPLAVASPVISSILTMSLQPLLDILDS